MPSLTKIAETKKIKRLKMSFQIKTMGGYQITAKNASTDIIANGLVVFLRFKNSDCK